MAVRSSRRERIDVKLPEHASGRQRRELGAFARYCIVRLERELGECESWVVHVEPVLDGYRSRVSVRDRQTAIEEAGHGHDGPLAIWEAMCRLEQRLRER